MEKIKKLKISRVSFIWNYVIGLFLLSYLLLSVVTIRLSQTLTIFFVLLILLFFIEPETIILYYAYFMDPDNITEVKGILTKTQISIPYRSISGERLRKSFVGRIFNYGNIIITSPNNQINIRGIRDPEKLYRMIEEKLNKYRKG
jgi:membrane protein YdbS with pleckstrin-like domain